VNVVDQSPLDGTSLILDTVRHPREERVEAAARLVLERASIRSPDVEAMASGDHQVIDAHQLLHDRPVTTADNADGAAPRQRAHCLSHARGDDGVPGPVNDRGQRAVVVQEHGRKAPPSAH
jgi:hypothetical protein